MFVYIFRWRKPQGFIALIFNASLRYNHSICCTLSLICRVEFSAFFFFVAEQTRSQQQQQLVHVPTYRHLITSSYTILVIELCLIVLYVCLFHESWNYVLGRITNQENLLIRDNHLRETLGRITWENHFGEFNHSG